MKEDYCKVLLNLSKGSAYEYRVDSEIPTIIKFGRQHSGKFQEGKIEGIFENHKLHNIIYCIKRGMTLEEIYEQAK